MKLVIELMNFTDCISLYPNVEFFGIGIQSWIIMVIFGTRWFQGDIPEVGISRVIVQFELG